MIKILPAKLRMTPIIHVPIGASKNDELGFGKPFFTTSPTEQLFKGGLHIEPSDLGVCNYVGNSLHYSARNIDRKMELLVKGGGSGVMLFSAAGKEAEPAKK